MKKILISFSLLILVETLNGCKVVPVPPQPAPMPGPLTPAPEQIVYGMPESAWVKLGPKQQSEIIKGYNQQQLLAEQNEAAAQSAAIQEQSQEARNQQLDDFANIAGNIIDSAIHKN